MSSVFVPILMLVITLAGSGIALVFLKETKPKKGLNEQTASEQTAHDFVNVLDIRDKYLYTRDGYIVMYIKINPISIDLHSEREKAQLCKQLTAELSSEQSTFKFIACSRPVDISPLIHEYSELMHNTANQVQKELLKAETLVMSNYALGGEVVERQFYMMIWEHYAGGMERDIEKRASELLHKFQSCSIRCDILNQQEIVRLCNLINNPAYIHIEDNSFEATIPLFS